MTQLYLQEKIYGLQKLTIDQLKPTATEVEAVEHKFLVNAKQCINEHISPRYTTSHNCLECQRLRAQNARPNKPTQRITAEEKAEQRKEYYQENTNNNIIKKIKNTMKKTSSK